MSKYIDFVAKVRRSKSNRKTRKRGGDITNCVLTPLTKEVTVDDLKNKIKHPQELKSLEPIRGFSSGSFNIATRVRCRKKPDEEIVCRVWKKAFEVDKTSIQCLERYDGCVHNSLESFAEELTISIHHSTRGNTLPIYDIQAIFINNPLLRFLSEEQKRKIFGQYLHDKCVCLCVIMKKGEPYEITRDNFHKTMELFGNIAESHLCVDIKPDNLLSSNGEVVMIDWDPQFIQKTTELSNITDQILFSSCMMKYLFCMFLLIQKILDDDFFDDVISELDEIIHTQIRLTDGSTKSVLLIITLFYNNTDTREDNNIEPRDGLRFSPKVGFYFKSTFDSYLWSGFDDFDLDLYMELRPYLINCPKKARCENLCLKKDDNYTVKYDNSSKLLRYYINHQCSSGVVHAFQSWTGIHSCSTELTGVELTYNKTQKSITFSYSMNGKPLSEIFSHSKRRVAETESEDDLESEDTEQSPSPVVKRGKR